MLSIEETELKGKKISKMTGEIEPGTSHRLSYLSAYLLDSSKIYYRTPGSIPQVRSRYSTPSLL